MEPILPLDQVIPGDCIKILSAFPEKSVDLIFADPPYNLQLKGELWRPNLTKVDAVVESWDQFNSFEEYDLFTRAWLSACHRVLKDTGTIWVIGTYHNIFRVGTILQDLGFWILNDVIWVKTNPMPNFRGVRFTNAHETLIWAQKKKGARYTFNHHAMKAGNDDLQRRSDWYLPLCTGRERLRVNGSKAHATQKPEALLYRVILSSSKPGDIILDPFFGSGTTGAVAKKLHRHWIGVETKREYIRLARQRIARIQLADDPEFIFAQDKDRMDGRISFGSLLEYGLLQPGQRLYLDLNLAGLKASGNGSGVDEYAIILADGRIRFRDLIGSIHQVCKAILNAPSNGWQLWQYDDVSKGERLPIDQLREKARELQEQSLEG